MNQAATLADAASIIVDEMFPHSPEVLWKTLTTPALMGRWLMEPTGFEPVVGAHFTFQTTPAGNWDGVIRCEVTVVEPNARLVHTWVGGDEVNRDYGSRLDTVVEWTITRVEGGCRLRLDHSGFRMPKNEFAHRNMSKGWPKVVAAVGALASEEASRG